MRLTLRMYSCPVWRALRRAAMKLRLSVPQVRCSVSSFRVRGACSLIYLASGYGGCGKDRAAWLRQMPAIRAQRFATAAGLLSARCHAQ